MTKQADVVKVGIRHPLSIVNSPLNLSTTFGQGNMNHNIDKEKFSGRNEILAGSALAH